MSCSRELLEAVGRLAIEHNLVIHTHASENRDEIALIRSRTGRKNIEHCLRVSHAAGGSAVLIVVGRGDVDTET